MPSAAHRRLHIFAALALAGLLIAVPGAGAPVDGEGFPRLPEAVARFGHLNVTLTAAPAQVVVDGVKLDAVVFNGSYAGPVLRLWPGDRLDLNLVNRTTEPINLHFHGSHASPLGHGDNMHIIVPAGERFAYRLDIPRSQPPGLYWYHTHIHGRSEAQINAGLAGAMIIEGAERRDPEIAAAKPRLLVLKTFDVERPGDADVARLHGVVQTIDGAAHADLRMQAGRTEFWRIGNLSANDYFHLSLKGFRFRIVGVDGAPTIRPLEVDKLDIAPASRLEVLVTPPEAGEVRLMSGSTPTGAGRAMKTSRELALVHVEAAPARAAVPARAPYDHASAYPDLRLAKITARRTFTYTETAEPETYLINGKTFEHMRIDTRVPLGSIEEWTIRNDTDDMHTFHIHQVHFQVVAINGQPQRFDGVMDNVRVPERGEVTVRIPFTDRQILGRFMYHCHVLKHEDKGMMANIEVYDPALEPTLSTHAMPDMPGMAHRP
jgi:FtsP/CotA-like multicopper oxidase with cupredoxin domain